LDFEEFEPLDNIVGVRQMVVCAAFPRRPDFTESINDDDGGRREPLLLRYLAGWVGEHREWLGFAIGSNCQNRRGLILNLVNVGTDIGEHRLAGGAIAAVVEKQHQIAALPVGL
jgi:hypothetical protein